MKSNTAATFKSFLLMENKTTIIRPAVLVAVIYSAMIALVAVTKHYSLLDFVHIGTIWANHDPAGTAGYDGQFYYQLARNPLQAYQYMDNASFREQHILYPLVVGALSLGQTALIPAMLLLVNVVSVVLTVELVGRLLVKYGFSPWFSLAIGLYFGQTAGTLFDTAEPFTYFLVCLGVWLVLEKAQYIPAAIVMGLATLSREIALLFPLGYAGFFFLTRKWQACAQFLLFGVAPILAWLVCLRFLFGQSGLTFTQPFEHIPFAGIFAHYDGIAGIKKFALLILLMFIPTLAGWVLLVIELVRRKFWHPMYFILLANVTMITLMNHHSYDELISCGRIATGLVLAVLLYGMITRNKYVLWGAQFYTLTCVVFIAGTLLHFPSFIA
ncbi:MAG: AZOBR_p60025 family cell surface glycopolymer formation protein [Ktedonobacteraceae bacterium]